MVFQTFFTNFHFGDYKNCTIEKKVENKKVLIISTFVLFFTLFFSVNEDSCTFNVKYIQCYVYMIYKMKFVLKYL